MPERARHLPPGAARGPPRPRQRLHPPEPRGQEVPRACGREQVQGQETILELLSGASSGAGDSTRVVIRNIDFIPIT